MATTTQYIEKLEGLRDDLADNLVEKGVEASQDETLDSLVPKVLDISTGIEPTGTINIDMNGTYNVGDYASAVVNVPQDTPPFAPKKVSFVNTGYNGTSGTFVDIYDSDFANISFENVTNAEGMFSNSYLGTSKNNYKFPTLKNFHPTSMKNFFSSSKFKNLDNNDRNTYPLRIQLKDFNMGNVTDASSMFESIQQYWQSIYGSIFIDFKDGDYSKLKTVEKFIYGVPKNKIILKNFDYFIDGATSLENFNSFISGAKEVYICGDDEVLNNTLTIENKTFSSLTSLQQSFLSDSQSATPINYVFKNISLPNLTNALGVFQFFNNKSLTLDNIIIGKPVNFSNAFFQGKTFTNNEVDLSGLTCDISSAASMFHYCTSLKKVNFGDNITSDNCTSLQQMFYGCSSLEEVDLHSLTCSNTACVFANMFQNCNKLKKVNLSGLNMKVTNYSYNIQYMFYGCSSLEEIDMRNFDFTMCRNYYSMMLNGVPTTCKIIVKNQSQKDWFASKYPSWTNVVTPDEL